MSQSRSPRRENNPRPGALRTDAPRRVTFEELRKTEEKTSGWPALVDAEITRAQREAKGNGKVNPSPSPGRTPAGATNTQRDPAAPSVRSGSEQVRRPEREGAGEGEKGEKGLKGAPKGKGKEKGGKGKTKQPPTWKARKGEWNKKKGKGKGGKKGK